MRLIILFLLSIFSVGAFSQDLKSINEVTWKGELAMNDRLFIT